MLFYAVKSTFAQVYTGFSIQICTFHFTGTPAARDRQNALICFKEACTNFFASDEYLSLKHLACARPYYSIEA